jgi:hypothetical protein
MCKILSYLTNENPKLRKDKHNKVPPFLTKKVRSFTFFKEYFNEIIKKNENALSQYNYINIHSDLLFYISLYNYDFINYLKNKKDYYLFEIKCLDSFGNFIVINNKLYQSSYFRIKIFKNNEYVMDLNMLKNEKDELYICEYTKNIEKQLKEIENTTNIEKVKLLRLLKKKIYEIVV